VRYMLRAGGCLVIILTIEGARPCLGLAVDHGYVARQLLLDGGAGAGQGGQGGQVGQVGAAREPWAAGVSAAPSGYDNRHTQVPGLCSV
jgi:hypothetical protein